MKTLTKTFAMLVLLLTTTTHQLRAETPLDFEGDGTTDAVIIRYFQFGQTNPPIEWYVRRSTDGSLLYSQFGLGFSYGAPDPTVGDSPTPADFDGDDKTDIAIYRRRELAYYILNSSDGTVRIENFGGQPTDDTTAVGDYDGDGRADLALYRKDGSQPKNNYFIVRKSLNNPTGALTWVRIGSGSGTKRYPGDFDGDGKLDFCVFAAGRFTLSRSSDGGTETITWGLGTDRPIAGDVDGDGRTDFCVVREGTDRWLWYIRERDGGGTGAHPIIWGQTSPSTEIPFGGGDYDGDGKSDIAAIGFATPNQVLRVRRSSDGSLLNIPWGIANDIHLVPSHGTW